MAAGCTTITYNGITLLNVQTRTFYQDAVFDDSGTDLLYHKVMIRCVGYFVNMTGYAQGNPLVTAIGAAGNATTKQPNMTFSPSASYNFVQVRHKLQEQRRQFAMAFGCNADGSGGTIVLSASPAKDLKRSTPQDPLAVGTPLGPPAGLPYSGPNANILDVDLNNGPKSRVVAITHVSSDEVLRCEVEFEICKLECVRSIPDGLGTEQMISLSPAVLSNRWTVADAIDKNFMTTRTYAGRLRLASLGVDPNDFRSWVVPSVYPGFHRESMSFIVSADGLAIDYTVVDKEVVFSAPAPATTWRFSHTESTGDGKNNVGEVSVTLGGDRTVSRTLFVAMIAAIFDSVLYAYDPNNPQAKLSGQFIEELSITDDVSDDAPPLIHGRCRVRRPPISSDPTQGVAYQTFKFVFSKSLALSLDQLANFQSTLNAIVLPDGSTYGDTFYPYDPNFSRDNREEGEDSNEVFVQEPELFGPLSSASALACYLQNPCGGSHVVGALSQTGQSIDQVSAREDQTGQASPNPEFTRIQVSVVTTLPPDQNPPYSYGQGMQSPDSGSLGNPGMAPGPYQKDQRDSRIEQRPGSRIALPLAAPANPQSQPQPTPPVPSGPQFDPNNPPPAAPTPWIWPQWPTWRDRLIQNDPTTPYIPTPTVPTPTHAIVSLVPPTFYRTVRIVSERIGAPVQLPPPADILDPSGETPNQWLMSCSLIPQTTDLTSDGQMIFRAGAEYVYVFDRPPSLANLPVGITPWLGTAYQGTGPYTFGQPNDASGELAVIPA